MGFCVGLKICNCECMLSAEWKSPNKIIARSGPGKGLGEIIVSTRSGGVGTCTVQFRGYHELIGPLKESAVWVEEAPLNWGWQNSAVSIFQLDDPLGLSVEGDKYETTYVFVNLDESHVMLFIIFLLCQSKQIS